MPYAWIVNVNMWVFCGLMEIDFSRNFPIAPEHSDITTCETKTQNEKNKQTDGRLCNAERRVVLDNQPKVHKCELFVLTGHVAGRSVRQSVGFPTLITAKIRFTVTSVISVLPDLNPFSLNYRLTKSKVDLAWYPISSITRFHIFTNTWRNISNTRRSVLSDIQTPRSELKNEAEGQVF